MALAYADSVSLSITGDELYDEAYKILDIVNKERQANGLHPLVMDKELLQSAMNRSAELSIYFSHSSPCSQSYSTKPSFFYSEGENIAAGQRDAEDAMNSWMNSPGHRANILTKEFNSIGVGVFKHDGIMYFTQIFTSSDAVTGNKPSNKTVCQSIQTDIDKVKVLINKENLNLKKGNKDNLYLLNVNQGWKAAYAKLNNDNIIWQSTNTKVAQVTTNGDVTAVGKGEATIKATLAGEITVSCKVNVTELEPTPTPEPTPEPDPTPTPQPDIPSKVLNLKSESTTSKSVKLNWNDVSNVSGYAVYRKTGENGKFQRVQTVSNGDSYCTDKSLTSGTTYYYRVRAYKTFKNKNYYGSYSDIITTTTSPSKVYNLHVDSKATNTIKLDWNNVSRASKYAVYRATSKNDTYKKIATVSSNTSYYTDKNLTSATTYYYKVRAYKTLNNKDYYGSYSDIITTTTSPSKVYNLHTDSRTKTSIKVDWSSVSRSSGYAVYRSTSKYGTYKRVATVKSSYYYNKGLSKGKKYYYKVRAFKTVNGSNYYGSYSSVLNTYTSK